MKHKFLKQASRSGGLSTGGNIVAILDIEVPNYQFRRMVVKAMQDEDTSEILDLIVDLVEEVAGDPKSGEHLENLIEILSSYLPEDA